MFCAEPVSEGVHSYAQQMLCPRYINCYWTTEHGAIVMAPLARVPDSVASSWHTWPLPWIEVSVDGNNTHADVIILNRFPYQALTVWRMGDIMCERMRGDEGRWSQYFDERGAYMQGDVAHYHAESRSYTLHGRSDEVINVGGVRISTEDVESAALSFARSEALCISHVAVTGVPDATMGQVPWMFVVQTLTDGDCAPMDFAALQAYIQSHVDPLAVPVRIVSVDALPVTMSGKVSRAALTCAASDMPFAGQEVLSHPCVLDDVRLRIQRHAQEIEPSSSKTSLSASFCENVIVHALATLTGVDAHAVDVDSPFMNHGVTSAMMASLFARIGASCSCAGTLSPLLAFEYSTPRLLARYLASSATPSVFRTCSSGPQNTCVSWFMCTEPSFYRWPCGAAGVRAFQDTSASIVGNANMFRWPSMEPEANANVNGRAVRNVAMIADVDLFDAALFGMSEAEVMNTDPQQRMLLEVARGVVHDVRDSSSATEVAVVIGVTHCDMHDVPRNESVYNATRDAPSVVSGRLSFTFDMTGPCTTVDAACASSIVALHVGMGSAYTERLIAGAVNLVLLPHTSTAYARAGMLSIMGSCSVFDARADGYVRAEGVGACSVTKMARSTAKIETYVPSVLQDGRTASLTAPNGLQQTEVILRAWKGDGGPPGGMHELHGTGTPLGDPTEARALERARPSTHAAAVQGVKSNTGHAEPCAGMAGIAALCASMQQRSHAPLAQLRVASTYVRDAFSPAAARSESEKRTDVVVITVIRTQNPAALPAKGGVSSFGYSGTISHCLMCASNGNTEMVPQGSRKTSVAGRRRLSSFHRRRHLQIAIERCSQTTDALPFIGVLRSAGSYTWEGVIQPHEVCYLSDHRVGRTALLPGTCYIEMMRPICCIMYDNAPFCLENVRFESILFLDDGDASSQYRNICVRAICDTDASSDGQVVLQSQTPMESSAWVSHSRMALTMACRASGKMLDAVPECPDVDALAFYASTGNDYRGEFKSMTSAWLNGSAMVSEVRYSDRRTHDVHLRNCAWLDACLHAPIWWYDHGGRPFYIASVERYIIHAAYVAHNDRFMSAAQRRDGHRRVADHTYFDGTLECAVTIRRSEVGFFAPSWLDARRTMRHAYDTHMIRSEPLLDEAPGTGTPVHVVDLRHSSRHEESMALVSLVNLLSIVQDGVPIHVLTQNTRGRCAEHAGVIGMMRVRRQEDPWTQSSVCDVPLVGTTDTAAQVVRSLNSHGESEAWLERGVCRLPRLQRVSVEPAHYEWHLTLSNRGSLSFMRVVTDTRSTSEMECAVDVDDTVRCCVHVRVVGLNFRDVLNVLGEYPGDPGPPGLDCAGHVRSATGLVDVVGFAYGALASRCITDARLVAHKPPSLSFVSSCTLPITFTTAHVSWAVASLRARQTSLVHAAAGGVGIVAIEMALWVSCQTFGTCSTPAKLSCVRHLLRHGTSSRRPAAFAHAAECHRGDHVDATLNSLVDDFVPLALACGGEAPCLSEIGKRRAWTYQRLAAAVSDTATYAVVAVDSDMVDDPSWMQTLLQGMCRATMERRATALPATTFSVARGLVRAFKLLQSGTNIGKVVITNERVARTACESTWTACQQHVVLGGTGGIGRTLCRWLSDQRARCIVTSRHANLSVAADMTSEYYVSCDAACAHDVARLLSLHLPVHVWHLAGALRDAILRKQTYLSMAFAHAPKARGAHHLHRGCARTDTRTFVCFSSIAALMYSAGQANYAASNTILDFTCMWRRNRAGIPATSVQWGPWTNVGMAQGLGTRMENTGVRGIGEEKGRTMFEWAFRNSHPVRCLAHVVWSTFLQTQPWATGSSLLTDMRVSCTTNTASDCTTRVTSSVHCTTCRPHAHDLAARVAALARSVSGKVSWSHDQPFMDDGLDSLAIVELRNVLQQELQTNLPATVLFDHPSARSVTAILGDVTLHESTILESDRHDTTTLAPTEHTVVPRQSFVDIVIDMARQVTGARDRMTSDEPFMDAGIDSLGMVEVKNQLASLLSSTLPATLLFDHPTPRTVGNKFQVKHHEDTAPSFFRESVHVAQSRPCTNSSSTTIVRIGATFCTHPGRTSVTNVDALSNDRFHLIQCMSPTMWQNADRMASLDATVRLRACNVAHVNGWDLFDANRFGTTAMEAQVMDPQHAMVLEHACQVIARVDSHTSVSVGISMRDFEESCRTLSKTVSATSATATAFSIASGRVSYAFGLQGAAVTVDTACSSGLVATGVAERVTDSSAVVAAVNVILLPSVSVCFAIAGMTSPSGACHTLDVRADGYVRAEGCSALHLSRDDTPSSTDSGTMCRELVALGIRQDGRSATLTSPNGTSQLALLQTTADKCIRLPARVELHGTGTALGDPIETGALDRLLTGRPNASILCGSCKSNIGHAEPHAGMSGLMRALSCSALAMSNTRLRIVNPNVCLRKCTPPLSSVAHSANASAVSSFGYSGTLAHAVANVCSNAVRSPYLRPLHVLKRRIVPHPTIKWRLSSADMCSRYRAASCELRRTCARMRVHESHIPPAQCEVVVVGAGFAGVSVANAMDAACADWMAMDEALCVGGVWTTYGNACSRVNSSEPSYCIGIRASSLRRTSRTNHTHAHELLDEIRDMIRPWSHRLYLGLKAQHVRTCEVICRSSCGAYGQNVSCKLVVVCTNRRLGTPRDVHIPDEHLFRGRVFRGIGNDLSHDVLALQDVCVLGMGAFAIEIMRTSFESGAASVRIVCRQRGTVCPQAVDWINFIRVPDEQFRRDSAGDARIFLTWRNLYATSGAVPPEAWHHGILKPDGHTVSTSDVFFIAHASGQLRTVRYDGSLDALEDGIRANVICDTGGAAASAVQTIQCSVLVKCVGFDTQRRNTALLGTNTMRPLGMVHDGVWLIAEPHLDSRFFNSPFGSSFLNQAQFVAKLVLLSYRDSHVLHKVRAFTPATCIDTFRASDVVDAIMQLVRSDTSVSQLLRGHVDEVRQRFTDAMDIERYVSENERLWYGTCWSLEHVASCAGRFVRTDVASLVCPARELADVVLDETNDGRYRRNSKHGVDRTCTGNPGKVCTANSSDIIQAVVDATGVGDADTSLVDHGMDSIQAAELVHVLGLHDQPDIVHASRTAREIAASIVQVSEETPARLPTCHTEETMEPQPSDEHCVLAAVSDRGWRAVVTSLRSGADSMNGTVTVTLPSTWGDAERKVPKCLSHVCSRIWSVECYRVEATHTSTCGMEQLVHTLADALAQACDEPPSHAPPHMLLVGCSYGALVANTLASYMCATTDTKLPAVRGVIMVDPPPPTQWVRTYVPSYHHASAEFYRMLQASKNRESCTLDYALLQTASRDDCVSPCDVHAQAIALACAFGKSTFTVDEVTMHAKRMVTYVANVQAWSRNGTAQPLPSSVSVFVLASSGRHEWFSRMYSASDCDATVLTRYGSSVALHTMEGDHHNAIFHFLRTTATHHLNGHLTNCGVKISRQERRTYHQITKLRHASIRLLSARIVRFLRKIHLLRGYDLFF